MPYSLKDRNVLVTGGSRGIGALVAERFASEGANVAINYVSNEERAKETESKITSQYNVKTTIIQGDLGIKADCVRIVKTAIEKLGGLDIVVSNAGWTKFSNFGDLDALDEDEWDKCWSTNVKGHMHTFREALPTFNANPEGGVFIITASIAGLIPSGSSMAYSVTKAASVHLVKCLAKTQGSKVRINAVCPGLLLTEWGNIFPKETIQNIINQASLKRLADLDDTADLYITLAKNTSMTGQCLTIDGGLAIL